mmetsp:Transcript_142694/g.355670  ORF Transcript_142694/g.355670 Transcript_142694/m.355670 type:complete len:441 (+) Transcript_142694:476-1798(+)
MLPWDCESWGRSSTSFGPFVFSVRCTAVTRPSKLCFRPWEIPAGFSPACCDADRCDADPADIGVATIDSLPEAGSVVAAGAVPVPNEEPDDERCMPPPPPPLPAPAPVPPPPPADMPASEPVPETDSMSTLVLLTPDRPTLSALRTSDSIASIALAAAFLFSRSSKIIVSISEFFFVSLSNMVTRGTMSAIPDPASNRPTRWLSSIATRFNSPSSLASMVPIRASDDAIRTDTSPWMSPRNSAIIDRTRLLISALSSAEVSLPRRRASSMAEMPETSKEWCSPTDVAASDRRSMAAAVAFATSSVSLLTSARALQRSLRSSATSRPTRSISLRIDSRAASRRWMSSGLVPGSGAASPAVDLARKSASTVSMRASRPCKSFSSCCAAAEGAAAGTAADGPRCSTAAKRRLKASRDCSSDIRLSTLPTLSLSSAASCWEMPP